MTSSLITNMASTEDEGFMELAIKEAFKSIPVDTAYCVGAILVKESLLILCCLYKVDVILTTGYSRELEGNTHAEECCLMKAREGNIDIIHSTIYTTMEPCTTRLSGKKSCTDLILASGIARVVIGVLEPTHFVKCEGISKLSGIKVDVINNPDIVARCTEPNKHLPI